MNKLTKEQLANKLNITRQTLSNWEKTKPYLSEIIYKGLTLVEENKKLKKDLINLNIDNKKRLDKIIDKM